MWFPWNLRRLGTRIFVIFYVVLSSYGNIEQDDRLSGKRVHLNGFKAVWGNNTVKVSHLLFVDDTLVFCDAEYCSIYFETNINRF